MYISGVIETFVTLTLGQIFGFDSLTLGEQILSIHVKSLSEPEGSLSGLDSVPSALKSAV